MMQSFVEGLHVPLIPAEPAEALFSGSIDELAPLVPLLPERQLLVDARYSRAGLYGATSEVYVREAVLERLRIAAASLPDGFRLVVYDGWRSEVLQRTIYENFRSLAQKSGDDASKYAFNLDALGLTREFPTEDAPHRTGGAIDVGLVGPNEMAWPMGTEFDVMSPLSATRELEILIMTGKAVDMRSVVGRRILYHAMTRAGFTNYPVEWWHYDFGNAFWRFYGRLGPGPIYRTVLAP